MEMEIQIYIVYAKEIMVQDQLRFMFYMEEIISRVFYYILEQNNMKLMKIGNFVQEITMEMEIQIYIVYAKEIMVQDQLRFMFYLEEIISRVFYYIQEQNYMRLMKIGNLDFLENIYVAFLKEVLGLILLKYIFQMEIIISKISCFKKELNCMKLGKILPFLFMEILFMLSLRMEVVILQRFIV